MLTTAWPPSIRIRLTIWYSAILACGLILFAVAVWILLKHALYAELQQSLTERTSSLRSFIVNESSEPEVHLTEELEEYCRALPMGTYFWISDAGQHKIFASNPAFQLPSSNAADSSYSPWRVWSLPRYLVSHQSTTVGGSQYQITGAMSTREARSILHELRLLLFTLLPVVLLIAAIGGFVLSRRALRPVDEITMAAQMLSIRDLSGRLPVARTGDELQRLSETWNSMLDRLQDAVQRLSRFTQDASHELRTPLAIIRSTAEIASRRSRTEESYRGALQQVVEESDRLTALIEDLLMLARGEQTSQPEMQRFSLSAMVSDVCHAMTALAREKAIRLTTDLSVGDASIYGNASLLRRLLVVLIDNALKYSPPASVITVRLKAHGEVAELSVEDQGLGIAEGEQAHIFERFYRGEAAREAWSNGAGLGLSLAASIARQHDAEIEVTSEPGQGSIFTIKFPAHSAQPLSIA